jgi:hypothetical protein
VELNGKKVTTTGLTFTTEDAVEVRTTDDPDVECVSYDIGVGLPVTYGGITWLDEISLPDDGDLDSNADGEFNHNTFSTYPTLCQNTDHPNDATHNLYWDEDLLVSTDEGIIIVAYEKGAKLQADGTYGLPATDMRGDPLIAKVWTKEEILDLALEENPSMAGTWQTFDDLPADYQKKVGMYRFDYMWPDREYFFMVT